jgi:hypothetical protein
VTEKIYKKLRIKSQIQPAEKMNSEDEVLDDEIEMQKEDRTTKI